MRAVKKNESKRARWDVTVEQGMKDGAAEVLAVIGRAYVVVDAVDGVVQVAPGAYALGLVRGHSVVSTELLEMIQRVRSLKTIVER